MQRLLSHMRMEIFLKSAALAVAMVSGLAAATLVWKEKF